MAMLSKKQVIERTGLSAATIWRRIQVEDFPKPRQLTPNRIAWPEAEIAKWENSRPVGQCELPENLRAK
jgi:predicted DNA-binding transcriptional regulator AlpA